MPERLNFSLRSDESDRLLVAKFPPNAPCPCGSGKKYKKCCAPYHKGAQPKDALTLMKSRYSAYAAGESGYILKTTHPDNVDFSEDRAAWKRSVDAFCKSTAFLGLEIVDVQEGAEEAYVTFTAHLESGDLKERSRFVKEEGRWFYHSGEFVHG